MSQSVCWMMQLADRWGNLASLAGLVIAVIGFGITIFGVWKSKTAAETAQLEVGKIRQEIRRIDLVSELSRTGKTMEEVQTLCRIKQWVLIPDRYNAIRQSLAIIRNDTSLPSNHLRDLTGMVTQIRELHRIVECILIQPEIDGDIEVVKINTIMSNQSDKLNEILANVSSNIGVEEHE